MLSDPMIDIPTPALINWPDISYHSSLDTLDKVSSDMLRLISAVGATYAYFIADSDKNEASALAYDVFSIARKRILDVTVSYINRLLSGTNNEENKVLSEAINKIDFIAETEERAIRSVLRIHLDYEIKKEISELCIALRDFADHEKKRLLSMAEKMMGRGIMPKRFKVRIPKSMEEAKYLVPTRKILGVPTLVDLPKEALMELRNITSESFPYSKVLCAPLFWQMESEV